MSNELTRIVGREGSGYRSFTCDAAAIRARAKKAFNAGLRPENEEPKWESARQDAIYLALIVEALIDEKQRALNMLQALREEKYGEPCRAGMDADMCPACGATTWSRPKSSDADLFDGNDWRDYSKRECSVCRWVRDDPDKST